MRILVLHNTYQESGGEDAVVAAENALLMRGGHDVHLEIVSNDSIQGLLSKLHTFLTTPHSARRKSWMRDLIALHKPDVVHIHNFFPLLTPAIHEAASESGVAVVQTLHNYRLLCAGALFLRDGSACEKCLVGSNIWSVVHRCYRSSLPGSVAIFRMQNKARQQETWQRHVHRFITLTDFARRKFIAGGLPHTRLSVKPNFAYNTITSEQNSRIGALFVGRLSPEKGADILLEAWRNLQHVPLTIAGDGPERARLEALAPPHVRFLGQCKPTEVSNMMAKAQALVMPSLCYEGFPMTLVEAFANNLPVIGSRLGAIEELIEDGITGHHFAPGDAADLTSIATHAFANPARLSAMGQAARSRYEEHYTPERNLEILEAIYREAIIEARNHISTPKDI
ncbi:MULTISPECIES: glycosyltransferase family 4 protein [Thalassospira]|uniref:Glycosyl transferase family 1 n=2 Tax=Thalassospira TaxID=168934 RepID=A0A367VZD4_9PROT|nr:MULTISPECIES: glycosyltransferase family 4 protein [Thalassospira]MDG4720115.1 glycosyltransferase family 4 protein [Thalassospira sp. FZY0004]RCK31766.1 hypothetical protein TH19_20310 [Thalassospira profundimaris]